VGPWFFKSVFSSFVDLDPDSYDLYVCGPPGTGSVSQRYGSRSFYHQAKIVRKNLVCDFFDFLTLKDNVNIPSKVISKKNFETIFCLGKFTGK